MKIPFIRKIIYTLLFFLVISNLACVHTKQSSQPLYPTAQNSWLFTSEKITLTGVGTNVTANLSAGVTMTLTYRQNELRAKGKYDSKNLFGSFDLPGKILPCYGEGYLCMQFIGNLHVGKDGSGFPSGSKLDYVMSITLAPNGAYGVYRINASNLIPYEQQGILKLYLGQPMKK